MATTPMSLRARDPSLEAVEALHDLVARAVDLGLARGSDALGGERLRRDLDLRRQARPLGRGFGRHPAAGERKAGSGGMRSAATARRRGIAPAGMLRRELRAAPTATASISAASTPENSATRRVSALNSIALRNAIRQLVVRLVHREVGERHVELHLVVERHQPLRQPRLLGVVDQRSAGASPA